MIFFRERNRGRGEKKISLVWEKNIHQLPPIYPSTKDWTHNLDICPDQNQAHNPVGVWDNTPTNWATCLGLQYSFLSNCYQLKHKLWGRASSTLICLSIIRSQIALVELNHPVFNKVLLFPVADLGLSLRPCAFSGYEKGGQSLS